MKKVNLVHETLEACPEMKSSFNFCGVVPCGGNRFYLDGINLERYSQQFPTIVSLVNEAIKLHVGFPKTNCNVNNTVLSTSDGSLYSHIGILPLTKTRKVPKFPVDIFFILNRNTYGINDFFGNLGMFPNGTIGKARLIRWKNLQCYTINASMQNGKLSIQRIDLSQDLGNLKTNLYVRKK